MLDEKKIREEIEKSLSPLAASSQRRMRIRAAVSEERQKETPMKRKISAAIIFALTATLLMASIALAEHLNLFGFFGEKDERYAAIAPEATLSISEPALLSHTYLGSVKAGIDSAYYDGLTLNLAYRIENSRFAEIYTPTPDEIAAMKKTDAAPVGLVGNEPGFDIYQAYNQAIQAGTPFGYRQYSVYLSDHTITRDGIDIPPYAAWEEYDENGNYCEIREFDVPLPDELRSRDQLLISIDLYQQETCVWFDGQECYIRFSSSRVGKAEAMIPKTKGALQSMTGNGKIGSALCSANAEISKMAASVTFSSDTPFDRFLQTPPEGTEASDCWVEYALYDEKGNALRVHGCPPLSADTQATVTFLGTGELPQELKLYVYTAWEGQEKPALEAMDAITLTISK